MLRYYLGKVNLFLPSNLALFLQNIRCRNMSWPISQFAPFSRAIDPDSVARLTINVEMSPRISLLLTYS